MREIDAALKDLNEALAAIGGCGDGGCVIVKPKGMHTNGGCRCPTNRLQMTRFAYAHNQFADAVRDALAMQAIIDTPDDVILTEAQSGDEDMAQRAFEDAKVRSLPAEGCDSVAAASSSEDPGINSSEVGR